MRAFVVLLLSAVAAFAAPTTISDNTSSIGSVAGDSIRSISIANNSFTAADGTAVSNGTQAVSVNSDGSFSVSLSPNRGTGGVYQVTYTGYRGTYVESLSVPVATGTIALSQARSSSAVLLASSGQSYLLLSTANFPSGSSGSGIQRGTSFPSPCTAGDTFVRTDQSPGTNVYVCNGSNSFVQVGGAGASLGYTPLNAASNLSDVASTSAALTNLGAVSKTANLSDIPSPSAALTNLGAVSKAANLSDLASTATALSNLGGVSNSQMTTAIAAAKPTRSFGAAFDGSGSALVAGKTIYYSVPYACTVNGWTMTVDTGTATIDIWKVASGTTLPTIANTITGSATPAITTGKSLRSTTLTGWSTALAANDVIGVNLKTVAGGVTAASLVASCQ